MNRIQPSFFYQDLPCSVVSIGCAMEKLQGKFSYDTIKTFSEQASANGNYATLQSVGEQVRRFFNVKRYTYYPRAQRRRLGDLCLQKGGIRGIVCVYGHFVFCDNFDYYSFFNNENDMVVAVWEI